MNRIFQFSEDGVQNMPKRGTSDKPNKLSTYKITNKMIAEWFGYKDARSFGGSSKKNIVLGGVKDVILYIENKLNKQNEE